MYIDVILPLPLDGVFTYSVPPELERQVAVGHRVLVPFGRNKTYVGIVASTHGDCPLCEKEAQQPDYRGTVPSVRTLGVCFDFQKVDEVPVDAFDIPVDQVI